MALESKPPFHPEVIRQQVRSFNLPENVASWQPKLQHWAGLIGSGRADDFNETALLPDFLSELACALGDGTLFCMSTVAEIESAIERLQPLR